MNGEISDKLLNCREWGGKPVKFLKKESGEEADVNLQRAFVKFGDPYKTDPPTDNSRYPLSPMGQYWVGICPRCGNFMHAVYYTQVGTRYMCAGCGYREGKF